LLTGIIDICLRNRPLVVLLALIEATLFCFSAYFAAAALLGSGASGTATPGGKLWPTAFTFAGLAIAGSFAMGLYSTRQRSTRMGFALRVVAAHLVAVALCALVFYIVPSLKISPTVMGLTVVIAIASSLVFRLLFERIMDQDHFKRRVLVYGAGQRAASLLALRRRVDQRGFRIVAFIAAEGDATSAPSERLTRRPDDLFKWAIQHEIDEIVVAMDDRRQGFPLHEFLEARLAGIEILAGCSMLCLLAIIPVYLRRGDRVYAAICIAEIAVLVLAASGALTVGH